MNAPPQTVAPKNPIALREAQKDRGMLWQISSETLAYRSDYKCSYHVVEIKILRRSKRSKFPEMGEIPKVTHKGRPNWSKLFFVYLSEDLSGVPQMLDSRTKRQLAGTATVPGCSVLDKSLVKTYRD